MPIEQSRVGEVTAQMMDVLDQSGYGEDAEITNVLLIVSVEDGQSHTRTHFNGAGMPTHVGVGLCATVQHALLNPS